MLRSLKQALGTFLTQLPSPSELDAMSMTLHHCIRLVKQEEQTEWVSPLAAVNSSAVAPAGRERCGFPSYAFRAQGVQKVV